MTCFMPAWQALFIGIFIGMGLVAASWAVTRLSQSESAP